VTAKDLYMFHHLDQAEPSLQVYEEIIDRTRRKWDTEVVQEFYGDRYVSHQSIRDNPDNYILSSPSST
jgi:hypothetical protein